ncbi:M16 family metallopeptidase [Prevotella sp. kh1p2]|uniref:M16 family metallopeptidase n=1 Tax=Prevotella sp. kh1p2 TaxID=1761883 RepID=UPI000B88E6E9|nr:insulinase family protein [Prevotella sp. kh1p2]
MKLRNLLLVTLLFVAGMAQAQFEMPAIPTDTAVRIGRLDNGLTYYIRYNNWPEHRANFYIAQKVGSIQEEESQRGLAHFLEHMAFNGSKHFKGNDLIEWCRSNGIEFGADLNAYTSIDQTVYNINNVPTTRQSMLDSCLLILSDWSTGLLLEQAEIEKERGVIHEEWRLRTRASSRMFERNLEKLYPGSKYGRRYPIGLMSVIDNFKRQELVDYYHKWYHPSHQGIIVVGDVDVNHVEAEIKKLFGSVKNPANEAPIVDEQVPDNATPIVVIDKDKEQQTSVVDVMFKHDVFPDSLKSNVGYLLYGYMKNAAITMLDNRYTEAAQKADCPYVNAEASDDNYIFSKTKDAFTVSVQPKDMQHTAEALQAALTEARRAAEFGFTATEYKRFQDNYISSLDKAYSNKDKRYTSQFYSECLGHFLTSEPMPPIEFTYQTMKQMVPMIPVDGVNEMMKEFLPQSDSNMVIINFNNEKEGNVYPTEAQLLGAVKAAREAQIAAYVDNVKNEPLIKELPKAGKIKKETRNEKLGYTSLELSNGVKVNLKQTDYKKDQVLLSGTGGGGSSLYGEPDYVNLKTFNDVIGISGLGNFSSTELQKALAGKIANADLMMSERRMLVSGNSTPKDVETMLQMVYLYFTNIRKDPDAFHNLTQQYDVALKNRALSPETAVSDSLTATLYDHNKRLKPLLQADVPHIDYDRILTLAKERTASAQGWTFNIVGNFDEATIRQLVCQYLGALPAKGKAESSKRASYTTKRNVENKFTRKMETPKAMAYMVWHNDQLPYTLEGDIQADMAGQVLSMVYLKQIREEASAAYTCGAYANSSVDDDGTHEYNLLGVCPMKPEKRDIALKIMSEEAVKLGTTCDAEMLNKVKAAMLKNADDRVKTNTYWNNIIGTYERVGLDTHTDYKRLVEAQTPQSVSAFMKKFLETGNKVSVIMLPQE